MCCWGHPVRDREKKQESDSSSEDGDAAELEGMSEEEKFLGYLDQVLFSSGTLVPGRMLREDCCT